MVTAAQAQFANNTAIWTTAPFTQAVGQVTDNLVIVPIASGLVVTGTWQVTLGAGPQSGTLLEFEAARLMQTAPYSPSFNMSLNIPGTDYITRPSVNSVASGRGTGSIDQLANSVCTWSFPNSGSGNYYYGNGAGFLSISPLITYSGGANRYMRVKYSADFVYNGNGGTYFFTFPLTGEIQTVPEPASALLLLAGAGIVTLRRRPGVWR